MLLGLEKKHAVRYVGHGLPADAEASEFMYQSGDLFNRYWEFRVLLRCVLDDPCVQDTLAILEDARRRQKHDREYRIPSDLDGLLTGNPGKKDLEERVARLYARLVDPDGPYWFPAEGELLDVTVLRTGRQNWMVRCGGARISSFYLRGDGSAPPHGTPGSTLRIRVTKRWYHRRRLYVVGTEEPAGE